MKEPLFFVFRISSAGDTCLNDAAAGKVDETWSAVQNIRIGECEGSSGRIAAYF